jgi:hypothetical protein
MSNGASLHASGGELAQLEQDAATFAGTHLGHTLAWALAEIRRLRAHTRELDQALSDAEWRLSQPSAP